MLRVSISYEHDVEIYISGNKIIVNKLHSLINNEAWVCNKQEYIAIDGNNNQRSEEASFTLGLWNLKTNIGDKFIVNIILDIIADTKSKIDDRIKYIMEYWAFESKMLSDAKSYRSRFDKTSQNLTLPITINTILDRCWKFNFIPPKNLLFDFLEGSDAMKGKLYYISPVCPYKYELDNFSKMKVRSIMEVRKSAKVLAVVNSDKFCFFSRMPSEVSARIASHTGDRRVLSEDASLAIATDCYFETKTINAWR